MIPIARMGWQFLLRIALRLRRRLRISTLSLGLLVCSVGPSFGGILSPEILVPGPPLFVSEAGGEAWLGTNKGLYRWVDGQMALVQTNAGWANSVSEAGGEVWLRTVKGVYRWGNGQVAPVLTNVGF